MNAWLITFEIARNGCTCDSTSTSRSRVITFALSAFKKIAFKTASKKISNLHSHNLCSEHKLTHSTFTDFNDSDNVAQEFLRLSVVNFERIDEVNAASGDQLTLAEIETSIEFLVSFIDSAHIGFPVAWTFG